MTTKASKGFKSFFWSAFPDGGTIDGTYYDGEVTSAELPDYYRHSHGGKKRDKKKAKLAKKTKQRNRKN